MAEELTLISIEAVSWPPVKFPISDLVLPLGSREIQLRSEPGERVHVSLSLSRGRSESLLLDNLYRDPPHPSWLIWQKYKAPQPRPWSEAARSLARLGLDGGAVEAARTVLADDEGPQHGFILGTAPLYAGVLRTSGRLRVALFTRTTNGDGYIVDAVWVAPTTYGPPEICWLSEANEGKWWWPNLRRPSAPVTAESLAEVARFFMELGFDPEIGPALLAEPMGDGNCV